MLCAWYQDFLTQQHSLRSGRCTCSGEPTYGGLQCSFDNSACYRAFLFRQSKSLEFPYNVHVHVYLVDNYDSFTYNLYQCFGALGARVTVAKNDAVTVEGIRDARPSHLVISPGPGTPANAGVSMDAITAFAGVVPVLGVCLGHQCLGALYSSRGLKNIVHAPELLHGKTSSIRHTGQGILRGLPSPFIAARYHSLLVREMPACMRSMGTTRAADGSTLIMGMMHASLPVFGVQFHPESFLTRHGQRLLRNFLQTRV